MTVDPLARRSKQVAEISARAGLRGVASREVAVDASEHHQARATATSQPVDRAAIFTSVLKRNALRREAHLPLLDVRVTYERELAQALWRAHANEHYEAVRAEVVARLRARFGPKWGFSAGARWHVEIETDRELRRIFRRIFRHS